LLLFGGRRFPSGIRSVSMHPYRCK
jgi:hypothetical protein